MHMYLYVSMGFTGFRYVAQNSSPTQERACTSSTPRSTRRDRVTSSCDRGNEIGTMLVFETQHFTGV